MSLLNAQIEFKSFKQLTALTQKGTTSLAIGLTYDGKTSCLSRAGMRLSDELKPVISELESLKLFRGEFGQIKSFLRHGFSLKSAPFYRDLILAGIGNRSDCHAQNILHLGGLLAAQIKSHKLQQLDVAVDSFHHPAASAGAEDAPKDFAQRPLLNPPPTLEQTCTLLSLGIMLGLYSFDRYKKVKEPLKCKIRFVSQTLTASAGKSACEKAEHLAQAVNVCRDMQTTPSNDLTPALLAETAKKLADEAKSIRIQILDEKALKAKGFGGILSVGHGSINPPRLIVMDYNPSKKSTTKPVVLVGKGITFDTGGTSLKPAPGMEAMKMDMSGAASVIAAVYGAALLKINQRVIAVVPSAENRISDRSTNPGDIYTAYNGKTVEVLNTDAEGRLILADALSYAAELKPAAVIDIATLTGACVIALGAPASGLMGNNGALIRAFARASENIGEKTWELPLYKDYSDDLKSSIADYRNIGSNKEGGASKAGCFLNLFVDNQYPWIHLDVASTADTPRGQGAHCPENVGTGVPVRGLIEFCEFFGKYMKS